MQNQENLMIQTQENDQKHWNLRRKSQFWAKFGTKMAEIWTEISESLLNIIFSN